MRMQNLMPSFEHVGRAIDEELRKLKRFLSEEVRPTTKRRLAEALRVASQRLGKLAEELDHPEDASRAPTEPASPNRSEVSKP